MFWGTVMTDPVMRMLKNVRISGGALLLGIAMIVWVNAWANDKFAKVTDLAQLQQTVDDGFESIAIEGASQEIRDVKLSKQIAQSTGSPTEDIDERLDHAIAYKQCLVERGSNCKHLRDVE